MQAEVIYTSMGMPLFGLDDAELRAACFRAFNDWAAEYCSHDFKRLIPLGTDHPRRYPERAAAELQRIAKKGMKGAMIWAEAARRASLQPSRLRAVLGRGAGPQYAALAAYPDRRAKGTGADQRAGRNFLLSLANLHHQIERSISVMVYGGVFEKFPRLRIVSAENDVGWMAYFMYRLDTVQNRLGAVGGMKLPMRASDYIKRQVFATFIADPVFVDSLHRYGPDNIMWSSDYPHTAATFPRSQEIVAKRFGTLPAGSIAQDRPRYCGEGVRPGIAARRGAARAPIAPSQSQAEVSCLGLTFFGELDALHRCYVRYTWINSITVPSGSEQQTKPSSRPSLMPNILGSVQNSMPLV